MQIGTLTPDSSISKTHRECWGDRAKTNQTILNRFERNRFCPGGLQELLHFTLQCTYFLAACHKLGNTIISSFLNFSIVSVWGQGICLPGRQIWRLEGCCCLNSFLSHVSGSWNPEVLGLSRTTLGGWLWYLHLCAREELHVFASFCNEKHFQKFGVPLLSHTAGSWVHKIQRAWH